MLTLNPLAKVKVSEIVIITLVKSALIIAFKSLEVHEYLTTGLYELKGSLQLQACAVDSKSSNGYHSNAHCQLQEFKTEI